MNLEKVEQLIRPLIEQSGFQLYDVEFLGRILRVVIEKPEVGVSLQDCVEISRLLNPLLDVEDVVPGGRYELEVSSPGLDRDLRRPEHFAAAIGEQIHVTTQEALSKWNAPLGPNDTWFEKRRNVRGELVGFDGATLKLSAESHEVAVPLGAVTKAYVDFELKITPKKGKKV